MIKIAGDLEKIKTALLNLKPSEKKIANYILKHPEEISDLPIAELAQKCGTSDASVVRFSRSLGYKGYQDLKIKISSDIAFKSGKIQGVVNTDDDLNTVITKISKNNMLAIENTMDVIDRQEVDRAVNALINAGKIRYASICYCCPGRYA